MPPWRATSRDTPVHWSACKSRCHMMRCRRDARQTAADRIRNRWSPQIPTMRDFTTKSKLLPLGFLRFSRQARSESNAFRGWQRLPAPPPRRGPKVIDASSCPELAPDSSNSPCFETNNACMDDLQADPRITFRIQVPWHGLAAHNVGKGRMIYERLPTTSWHASFHFSLSASRSGCSCLAVQFLMPQCSPITKCSRPLESSSCSPKLSQVPKGNNKCICCQRNQNVWLPGTKPGFVIYSIPGTVNCTFSPAKMASNAYQCSLSHVSPVKAFHDYGCYHSRHPFPRTATNPKPHKTPKPTCRQ